MRYRFNDPFRSEAQPFASSFPFKGKGQHALALMFAVALVVGCGKKDAAPTPEQAMRHLPPDTNILIAFHVPAFAGSTIYKQIESELLDVKGLGDVLRQTNKPLHESVEWLYVALAGDVDPRSADNSQGLVALFQTSLGDKFLSDAMVKTSHEFTAETVDGVPMWVSSDDMGISLMKGGYFTVGSPNAVRETIRRGLKKSEGLTAKSPLFVDAGEWGGGGAMWGVARMTPALESTATSNPITKGLVSIHHLTWTAESDPVNGLKVKSRAICNSVNDASDLRT
ncbi:MAG: hypothetical protein O3A46_05900, partial [Candidatus Poribacteria bacterium]|nr:hypothetical protein [Candidatus Poribacteria bacterium]